MNGKSILGVLVGLIAFFGVKYGFEYFSPGESEVPTVVPPAVSNNPAYKKVMGELDAVEEDLEQAESIEEALRLTEKALVKTLPLQLDEFTVMTGVKAGPGKQFTYIYELRGEEVEALSAEELESAMRPQLESQYNGPAMRAYKEGGVTAIYRYSDSKGNLISEIKILP